MGTGSDRSRVGNGNPLQYSCLENPMDRGVWWATVHGVAKSWTRLSSYAHRCGRAGSQGLRFGCGTQPPLLGEGGGNLWLCICLCIGFLVLTPQHKLPPRWPREALKLHPWGFSDGSWLWGLWVGLSIKEGQPSSTQTENGCPSGVGRRNPGWELCTGGMRAAPSLGPSPQACLPRHLPPHPPLFCSMAISSLQLLYILTLYLLTFFWSSLNFYAFNLSPLKLNTLFQNSLCFFIPFLSSLSQV